MSSTKQCLRPLLIFGNCLFDQFRVLVFGENLQFPSFRLSHYWILEFRYGVDLHGKHRVAYLNFTQMEVLEGQHSMLEFAHFAHPQMDHFKALDLKHWMLEFAKCANLIFHPVGSFLNKQSVLIQAKCVNLKWGHLGPLESVLSFAQNAYFKEGSLIRYNSRNLRLIPLVWDKWRGLRI